MQPPDAVAGWDDDQNAELYARFTRDYPFYARTSRDLAARASLPEAQLVVDLCGGTGITAAIMLETLPPGARIVSIDAAKAMQAAGRRVHPDPRISWIVARAEDTALHIREPADAVVCNSAIWKTNTPAVFAAVKQALRPGGRFVFNIGGSFAGLPPAHSEPRSGPSLNELIIAVAAAEYGYPPTPHPRPPAPLTADIVRAQLGAAGFSVLDTETVTHIGTLQEKRAWLSIPVFARPPGQFTYEQRMEILERAYAQSDVSQPVTTAWLVVTAEA
ncbi:class I SAM-dependent methyltransferase [Frankia sp. AgB1.9]|uniref:class I SAM-dependent methyltransferase n=1 Tax=unclassified Frankia TaxID=2632575 RepID=UPI001932480F|nr:MULTISPECIES: class I SAM-dependent methyltransferase [unclassified Frankia]MBL7489735.1 class I SAM-dependent methyltransferase [Frankia sp. AgW1.1]MBL7551945.1 class I SAM-dependent methyltransferase [Frankia sp. AgB1.9]MBL7623216.1 class I SAM-dependent methyltransferase [Frankia sp. AgB1.8]